MTFHWHYYQKYLPEKLKYDEKKIPVETYWDWRGNKIHLDVYARKDASCKVILVHGGGKVSFRFLRTFMNYNPELEPEKFDVCKILLMHPGLDPWTPFKISKTFYDKLKAPKKLVILEGAGHFPYEEPGLSMASNSLKEFIGK